MVFFISVFAVIVAAALLAYIAQEPTRNYDAEENMVDEKSQDLIRNFQKEIDEFESKIAFTLGATITNGKITASFDYKFPDANKVRMAIDEFRRMKRELAVIKQQINLTKKNATLQFSIILPELPMRGTGRYYVRQERARVQDIRKFALCKRDIIIDSLENIRINANIVSSSLDSGIQGAMTHLQSLKT